MPCHIAQVSAREVAFSAAKALVVAVASGVFGHVVRPGGRVRAKRTLVRPVVRMRAFMPDDVSAVVHTRGDDTCNSAL